MQFVYWQITWKKCTTLYWWTNNFKGTMYSFWLMIQSDKKTSCIRHKKKNWEKSFHLFLSNNNKHLVFAKAAVMKYSNNLLMLYGIFVTIQNWFILSVTCDVRWKGLGQLRNKRSSVGTRVVMDRSSVINSRLTKVVTAVRKRVKRIYHLILHYKRLTSICTNIV